MASKTPVEASHSDPGGFTPRLVTVILAVCALAAAVGAWQLSRLGGRFDAVRARQAELGDYTGRVMLLDEVVAMSARLAVATGDDAYERRYGRFEGELDALLETTERAQRAPEVKRLVQETAAASRQRAAIERRAFALAFDGRRAAASALLSGGEYARWRAIYAGSAEKTATWYRAESERGRHDLRALAIGTGMSFAAVVLVLLWAWYYARRAGRRQSRDPLAFEAAFGRARDQPGGRGSAPAAAPDPGNHGPRRGIDERQRAQEQLAIAAAIVENSPVIVGRWRFPAAGVGAGLPTLEYISANVAQFGYSAEDILSGRLDFFRDIVHPDDGERALKPMVEAARQRRPGASAEFRLVRKDGVTRWVEGHMRFETDAAGAVVVGQGVLRDVTEDKQSANDLRETRAALAEAQAVAHLGSWQFNLRDRSVIWSDECYRIFGVDRATFVPTFEVFLAYVHPDDRDALIQTHNQSVADHAPRTLHHRIVLDDGTVRVAEQKWQNYYDAGGTPLRTTGTIQDITERTRAEDVLRRERDFSAALIDGLPGMFFVLDSAGRVVRGNAALGDATGLSDAELDGMAALRLVVPGDRDLVRVSVGRTLETGHTQIEVGVPNRATGAVRRFATSASRIELDDGPGIIGMGVDVTGARRAEAAQALLAAIVESSRDAIVGSALDGAITSWNAAAEQMYGYGAGEAIGRSVHLIVPEERRAGVDRVLAAVARGDRAEPFEAEHVAKSGARISVSVSVSPVRDSAGKVIGASAIARDIGEQKRIAAALAYRDRLMHAVAVGTTALIQAEVPEQGIEKALRIVGESMAVDRVLVIQYSADRAPPVTLRYLWQAPDIAVPFDAATFATLALDPAAAAEWIAPLLEGKPAATQLATSKGTLYAMLEQAHNKSTLLMPIVIDGELWGMFGIDSCKVARDWLQSDFDTLGLFAEATGSLIRREEARLSLERSEERFRVLSATALDAIIMIDSTGHISYWNHAAERVLGYSADEAVGKQIHNWLAPPRFREKAAEGMKAFAKTGRGAVLGKTVELAALRKDGVEIAVELSAAAVQLDGEWQAIGILRDITERKRTEQKILDMARTDSLTGLANRTAFVDVLLQEIATARRGGKRFAVFYLDLDHFKDINDTLGHPVGDLLLQAVAERLRASIREVDALARFGGDEFAVIAADITEPTDAALLAEKLLAVMGRPFEIQSNEIRSGTSVGIALYGADASDAEALLSHADLALYRAKSDGRGTYRFFTETMDAEARTRVMLSSELRAAIETEQLFLLYQPQVDVETRRVIGLEALVRWNHPRLGVIGPDSFIHIAERTGLVVPLGRWVIREACRQIRAWLDAGDEPWTVAVNVSGLQFKAPVEFEGDIAAALAEAALEPDRLELELTETAFMGASREHSDVLTRLRASGLRLAIDDFGVGYSSLDNLGRFPVDRIKIAQSFIVDLATVPSNVAIVKAAISIGAALGVAVVAEGVETEAQIEMLKAWGCRYVQGFYFAPPLSPEAVGELMRGTHILPWSAGRPA